MFQILGDVFFLENVSLTIGSPVQFQQVNTGQSLHVGGYATGTGGVEPHTIESVTVQVDDQSPVKAKLVLIPRHPGHLQDPPAYLFSLDLQVSGDSGPHDIRVKATDDNGITAMKGVTVLLGLDTWTFYGMVTLTTDNHDHAGPYPAPFTSILAFSSDLTRAELISMGALQFTIPTGSIFGDDTATATFESSESGTLDESSGNISIPSVAFHVTHSISQGGEQDITFDSLSTTASGGSPLNRSNGDLTLVGGPSILHGGALDKTAASVVFKGTAHKITTIHRPPFTQPITVTKAKLP
jgi:hypothetical protein